MPPTDRFVAETTLHVRYVETDAMAIVHHTNHIIYFEEGRSSYARQRGSDYAQFEQSGFFLAVTEVNARYGKPARYGQRLTIRCWIVELKSRGVTFGYEIVEAESGDILVTGQTKHICITKEGQVAKLPESWRKWGS